MTNTNFGKCKFPNVAFHNDIIDVDSVLVGLGFSNDIPLVHKEDSYNCFESK